MHHTFRMVGMDVCEERSATMDEDFKFNHLHLHVVCETLHDLHACLQVPLATPASAWCPLLTCVTTPLHSTWRGTPGSLQWTVSASSPSLLLPRHAFPPYSALRSRFRSDYRLLPCSSAFLPCLCWICYRCQNLPKFCPVYHNCADRPWDAPNCSCTNLHSHICSQSPFCQHLGRALHRCELST